MKNILLALFILVLIIVAGWFYKAFKTVPTLPALENTIKDESGRSVKISDFKGQFVLISYFQTWCGSCIQELPSIDALQMKVGKENLKVIMISDEEFEKIKIFKEKYCNTLDYYRTDKPFNKLGIRVFPTTYLLNPKGEVIMSKLDAFDWSGDEVLRVIELSGK